MVVYKNSFYLLILVAVGLWLAIFSFPDEKLHLIACDVGQGEATLIVYGSSQILIDGGPNRKVLDCLGKYIPFWDRKIEGVILTHPDSDHYAGLIEVVKRYKIDNYLVNGIKSSNQSYQVLENEVGGRGIPKLVAKKGTSLRVGKIHLDIIAPQEVRSEADSNDNSLVIDLKYGDFEAILDVSLLFTGDVEAAGESAMLNQNKDISAAILKVPHHGSRTSSTTDFLNKVQPKLAVISVGKNNYGHPNEEVLKILEEKNIKTLRTDEMGDIEVTSDGN